MKEDDAMEIIFTSPQFRELMEKAKETPSPEEWREMSQVVLNSAEEFIQQHMENERRGETDKPFRA